MPSEEQTKATVHVADLVREYSALLYRVAHSVLRSPSEAEDAVQDCFLRVLEYRKPLADVRDMRVWLVRIVWNLALDRRRKIRPDQMDARFTQALAGTHLPADRALAESARMAVVLREIERLPKKEREVLLLSAMDELGTAEVAKVLDRSESATRALLFRARSRLRERLERGDAR